MPAHSRTVSKLPQLPTISEKVDWNAEPGVMDDAVLQEWREEERVQMIQALLMDACMTCGAYLIQAALAMEVQKTRFEMCLRYSGQGADCAPPNLANVIDSPLFVLVLAGLKAFIAYMVFFRSPLKLPAMAFMVCSLSLHMLFLEYKFLLPFLPGWSGIPTMPILAVAENPHLAVAALAGCCVTAAVFGLVKRSCNRRQQHIALV